MNLSLMMGQSLELKSCINQSKPAEAECQSNVVNIMIDEFNSNSISACSPISNPLPKSTDFAPQETDFEIL